MPQDRAVAVTRLLVGMAQFIFAGSTLLIWLAGAPLALVALGILVTGAVVLASRLVWRGR